MLRAIEGGGVLLLLSLFFAYVLAPAVAAVRRRVRIGRRQRPVSAATALILIYVVLFVPAVLAWRHSEDRVVHWVRVTAPAAVGQLFGGGKFEPLERLIGRAPLSERTRAGALRRAERAVAYIEREARRTLDELIETAPYAPWLAIAPLLAFLLLTGAPAFQRSTLRVLPRGHLQWRG